VEKLTVQFASTPHAVGGGAVWGGMPGASAKTTTSFWLPTCEKQANIQTINYFITLVSGPIITRRG
jgi:hypothetical protein